MINKYFAFFLLLFAGTQINASPFYMSADSAGHGPLWFQTTGDACDHALSHVPAGYTTYACEVTPLDYRNIYIAPTNYLNRQYLKVVIPVLGSGNPTIYVYNFAGVNNPPMPPQPSPENCAEDGLFYDKANDGCTSQCPNGALDNLCLTGAPVGDPNESDDGDCTTQSSDFKGVFQGKPYCDSNMPEPATCPDGQMQHIVIGTDGDGAYACGEPVKTPDEAKDDSETTTTETSTDANGNTTTTTTDQDGNTETTTTDSAGNSTTINNYPGKDSETGGPCTASSVACTPTPETEKGLCKDGGSLCDDVNEIKKSLEGKSERTDKTNSFDTAGANSEVTAAESELTQGINAIKSEMAGYFDLTLSGAEITCGAGVEVLGRTIQICPSEFKEELAIVGQIVLLMAGLISLLIVLR